MCIGSYSQVLRSQRTEDCCFVCCTVCTVLCETHVRTVQKRVLCMDGFISNSQRKGVVD
jgi:hypothetical protein